MKEETIFRLAKESDKDNILSLLNIVFNEQQRSNVERDDAFWEWKYKNNPFGQSLLIVVEFEDKLVGVSNLWPWEFTCRGETLRALQPCDSAVHPEHRGKGLFTKSRIEGVRIAKQQGFNFFFNFPNQNSLSAYLTLGWHYMGRINWHVKILSPLKIIKGKFKESKSETLFIPDQFSIDVDVLNSISRRNQTFNSYLNINRRGGYHRWRYVDHPTRKYGMATWSKGSKPGAAAIFTLNEKGLNREMVVVDILGRPENTIDLFKEVVKAAKYFEADFIAVIQNSSFLTNELWKLGFIKKKLKNMVVLPLNISLEQKITNFQNWNMVGAMHDST